VLSGSPPPATPPPGASTGRATGPGAVAAVLAVGALVAAAVVGAGLSSFVPTTGGVHDDEGPVEIATGASSDGYAVWARNDDGAPVRWDACSPIDLVVSPDGAPAGALEDLDEAVARLVEVTGLELRVTGTTDERPKADRPPYQPDRYGHRWAPVLIAWAQPHEGGIRLRTTDRGVAVPIAVGPRGDRTYVTAQVAFNAERTDLERGFEDRSFSWGSTVLHELVHVLGLDHVSDPTQLMHVHPGEGPVELGAGDLAGLAAVGAEQGCGTVPHPQPVEVAEPPR
jgi:hypothetical protein